MFYGTFFIYGLYVLLDVSTTTDRRQSKTPLTIDELRSKIARNSVFNCHLSSKWQPKTLFFTIIYLRLLIASFNMCPFKFRKHHDQEERAGCFTLIVLFLVTVNVLWLFLTALWVGLQCVVVCIS